MTENNKFYSAYDLQTGRYMSSGLNSKTRQECVNALADYLNSDSQEDDGFVPPVESDVCAFEFEIHEHEEELEDD